MSIIVSCLAVYQPLLRHWAPSIFSLGGSSGNPSWIRSISSGRRPRRRRPTDSYILQTDSDGKDLELGDGPRAETKISAGPDSLTSEKGADTVARDAPDRSTDHINPNDEASPEHQSITKTTRVHIQRADR